MTSLPLAVAAAGLASLLLRICLEGERPGDDVAVRQALDDLRRHAPDTITQSLASGLEADIAGLPLFSPDRERPSGARGYLSLVFELQAWAHAASPEFTPWLAPSPRAHYTIADLARDNYVATKSVTYAAQPLHLVK